METMVGLTETEIKMLASGIAALIVAILAGLRGLSKDNKSRGSDIPMPEQTAQDVDAVLRIINDLRSSIIDHQEAIERHLERIHDEQSSIRRETSIILDRMKR